MTTFARRWAAAFMPNYATPSIVLARGEGCRVWDVAGREYLDLIAGIAVSSLGHAHPALVQAVSDQVGRLAHTSNLVMHEPEILLAERLLALLGSTGRVFLANSGTEANECAVKLAIKYGKASGRGYLVAAANGFHGRTMGSLALTGKAAIREPFGPFGIDVRFVPYGDADALKTAVTSECAAVFLEPTQGEGGVVPPPPEYFAQVRNICDATGALYVADEIQSAVGRTGAWFATQHEGVIPDIVTLAKGLGGGLPIGACIGLGPAGQIFERGDHGSTFGGNPVSCAAALAVLNTVDLDHVRSVGRALVDGLTAIDHPLISAVRGRGLWLGLVLTQDFAGPVEAAARQAGFLVNAVRPDVVRLAPPLIITAAEVASFADALPAILEAACTS